VTAHLAALGDEEKFVDFFSPIPQGSKLIVMDSADGPSTGYASALATAFDTASASGTLAGSPPQGWTSRDVWRHDHCRRQQSQHRIDESSLFRKAKWYPIDGRNLFWRTRLSSQITNQCATQFECGLRPFWLSSAEYFCITHLKL
jgi:hypothetical protein